jgi:metallo-beta-lactamase family protein
VEGAKEVRIHKHPLPVLAEVRVLKGLSGHADSAELMRWLSSVDRPPRTIFVTHGEEDAALALADRIKRERGFDTHVPEPGESWPLHPPGD